VDAAPFYQSNLTAVQLLRQTAGIKVRQDGGYGSRVEFLVNGSTGKQLKFFLDGLPVDNLGDATSINTLPLEMIERIEIYKGVLPVELGADALGGAINIVTRKEKADYLDASYALSSFETHRAGISGRKFFNNHWYAGLQASGGYAKNNYKVDVEIPNEFYTPVTTRVRRFHDRFKNLLLKGEVGLRNTSWADLLALELNYSFLDRQLQNNLLMTQPYGQAFYRENLYSAQLKYSKILPRGFNISSQLAFNHSLGQNVDTSANVYVWDGRVFDRRLKADEAEMGAARYLLSTTNLLNHRLNLSWRPGNNLKLSFSNTLQYYRRTGEDTLALNANGGMDYYGKPAEMIKNVAGFALEHAFLEQRLKAIASIRHIHAGMKSHELSGDELVPRSLSVNNIGYNLAATYSLSEGMLLKASYEHAFRLPDVEEAFGNLMLIKPNPNLLPERSHNFNLNLLYSNRWISAEALAFAREVSNLIYFQTDTRGAGMSENLNNARVKGFELSLMFKVNQELSLNMNATYQDLRNRGTINPADNNNRYLDARIPNIPYLLGNAGINYSIKDLLLKGSSLKLWANMSYTQSYFLFWAIDGDPELKNRIPSQFLQNLGLTLDANGRLAFTLEAFNLTDRKTYDSFNVQLPGRSFSFKTRFYLSKKQAN
jgi:outer membrane receptor protein involved in Fe transport